MPQKCLIMGIDGQDGAYLARHLLSCGDNVVGTWFDSASMRRNFSLLNVCPEAIISERFSLPADEKLWRAILDRHAPNEIYLLAGVSSVGYSFSKPAETIDTTVGTVTTLLDIIRQHYAKIRFFYAGSVECFGRLPQDLVADEETPFHPYVSPYAIGKAAAMNAVRLYREAYGIYACSGILAPHESPLRPIGFVTRKIIDGIRAIATGQSDTLELGNLDVWRDWGWAEDYVEAYVKMLRTGVAADYILATGETHSLLDFVKQAFFVAGFSEWQKFVKSSAQNLRPSDIMYLRVNPNRARQELSWQARVKFNELIELLLKGDVYRAVRPN